MVSYMVAIDGVAEPSKLFAFPVSTYVSSTVFETPSVWFALPSLRVRARSWSFVRHGCGDRTV